MSGYEVSQVLLFVNNVRSIVSVVEYFVGVTVLPNNRLSARQFF